MWWYDIYGKRIKITYDFFLECFDKTNDWIAILNEKRYSLDENLEKKATLQDPEYDPEYVINFNPETEWNICVEEAEQEREK